MPVTKINLSSGVSIPVKDGSKFQQALNRLDKDNNGAFDVADIDVRPDGILKWLAEHGIISEASAKEITADVHLKYVVAAALFKAGEISEAQKGNVVQFLDNYVAITEAARLIWKVIPAKCNENRGWFGGISYICSADIYNEIIDKGVFTNADLQCERQLETLCNVADSCHTIEGIARGWSSPRFEYERSEGTQCKFNSIVHLVGAPESLVAPMKDYRHRIGVIKNSGYQTIECEGDSCSEPNTVHPHDISIPVIGLDGYEEEEDE